MSAASTPPLGILSDVSAPRPLLRPEAEQKLTTRQREVLDDLERLAVQGGFSTLTMAQLARKANCSLRTLYGLAPRKDELLLMVIDRRLHRIGRVAMRAIDPNAPPLSSLRAYLRAATVAVGPTTEAFARELAAVPGATRLSNEHSSYVIAVVQRLLERAVELHQIDPVDTHALALVLGGLGRFYSHPEIIPRIEETPKITADKIMDVMLRGLERR